MKNLLLVLALLLTTGQLLAINANLSFARFSSPESSYVELYLHVSGKSVTPLSLSDSTVQGAVNILMLFQQGEEIIKYDKYRLLSPESDHVVDFVDMKRFALPDGDYTLVVMVEDDNDKTKVREYRTEISLDFDDTNLAQSDIQLLASVAETTEESIYAKHGMLLEPMPYNFYGNGADVLGFYHEIYHSNLSLNEAFAATYKIESIENGTAKTILIGHKRQQPAAMNPLLIQMDISELRSGNYQLVVELRNKDRELLSIKKTFFQRSNPRVDAEHLEDVMAAVTLEDEFVGKLSKEELRISLLAIVPHLPQLDIEVVDAIIKNDSTRAQQTYLFSFWVKEDRISPEQAYRDYMAVVHAVDQKFKSGFRNGFETDRGYIYLKYGQPNDIVSNENEPSAPPYEIWSYDKISRTNQNNVRFIFHNPSLAGDDYVLLHSDVIGELQNPQWQMELYRDAPNEHPDDYFMGTDVQDNIGRNATRLLRDY